MTKSGHTLLLPCLVLCLLVWTACAPKKNHLIAVPPVPLAAALHDGGFPGRIHVDSVRDRRAIGNEREMGLTTIGLFNSSIPVVMDRKPSEVLRELMEGTIKQAGLLESSMDESQYVLCADVLRFDTRLISSTLTKESIRADVKVEVVLFNRASGDEVGRFEVTGLEERQSADVTGLTPAVVTAALVESQKAFAQELSRLLSEQELVRKQQPPFTPILVPYGR